MVLSCCVKGCRSESYKGCNVSFHRIPKKEEIRKKWVEVVPGNITNNSVVCSLHFTWEDFCTHPNVSKKVIMENAVPSIFPNTSLCPRDTKSCNQSSKSRE